MCVPYASTWTGSSRLADARPVRNPPSSCLSTWIAPCIRRLMSAMSCVAVAICASRITQATPACDRGARPPRSPDARRASLPRKHGGDRARLADREDDDRDTVFPGKREGRGIHYLEIALDRLLVGESIESLRFRVLPRIGAVHAVDIGRLEHRLAVELARPQYRGGVGREERIAGARPE